MVESKTSGGVVAGGVQVPGAVVSFARALVGGERMTAGVARLFCGAFDALLADAIRRGAVATGEDPWHGGDERVGLTREACGAAPPRLLSGGVCTMPSEHIGVHYNGHARWANDAGPCESCGNEPNVTKCTRCGRGYPHRCDNPRKTATCPQCPEDQAGSERDALSRWVLRGVERRGMAESTKVREEIEAYLRDRDGSRPTPIPDGRAEGASPAASAPIPVALYQVRTCDDGSAPVWVARVSERCGEPGWCVVTRAGDTFWWPDADVLTKRPSVLTSDGGVAGHLFLSAAVVRADTEREEARDEIVVLSSKLAEARAFRDIAIAERNGMRLDIEKVLKGTP